MFNFLQQFESTLKPLLDGIGQGVLVVDEHATPVLWNSATERLLGASTLRRGDGPWTERPGVFQVDGVTHLAGGDRPLPRAMRGEDVTDQEFVVCSDRGEALLLSATARVIRDSAQRTVGAIAIFREITAERRSETALRESERLYRTLAKQLPSSVVLTFDRTLHFVFAGGGGLIRAGYTAEQIEGHPVSDFATPEILPNYGAVFDGESTDVEIDRRGRLYRVQLVPVRDERDQILLGLMVAEDITESRDRRNLRQREEELRLLSEAIPQIVWTSNPDGNLDFYNQRWFDYTGMTLEQTRGWGWGPVLHPDDLENCIERWTASFQSGTDYEVEYRLRRASDGAYRWHLGRALPLRDSNGAIVKWFGTCTDIDDQRRARDVLLQARHALEERVIQRTSELVASKEAIVSSEAKFRAAAEGMKDFFYIVTAVRDSAGAIQDFRIEWSNAVAATRFKRHAGELVGTLQSELAPWMRQNGLFAQQVRVVERTESYEAEYRTSDSSDNPIWNHVRLVPLADGIAVTVSDITDQRRMNEERDLHAAVVKSINEGICLVRAADRTIMYANPKFVEMLGYAEGELDGKPVGILRPPKREGTDSEPPTYQYESGTGSAEVTNVRKDGRLIRCRATSTTLHRPEHGDVFVVVMEDITERKRLEHEREGFFSLSLDMLCVAGFDGFYRQLNPAWTTALGWTLEELMAKPFVEFVHPEDRASTIAETQHLADGNHTVAFENRYACKDGSYRVLQWRAVQSPLHALIFAAARDVTDLRNTQNALTASLSEKDVLLKEIHHRVKNNLQVISSLLKLHGDQVTDASAKAAFGDSQERVRAIALLHEKLYQSKDLGRVTMSDYAESLLHTLMRAHGGVSPAHVEIVAHGVTLPVDLAVPCGLILNELATNALKHAFPPGFDQTPKLKIAMGVEGKEVIFAVEDNGVGLPVDFVLGKSQTLGMHLVRTLARQLEAHVDLTGSNGTRWVLRFPADARGDR